MLVAQLRRVAVDVPEERLLAPVDHLHRPAGVQREHAGVGLHRDVLAPAERAADARQREAHLLHRQVEAGGDLVAVHVQPLGRDPEVDPAVLGRDRQAGLRPEEGLVLHPDLVLAADHDVGLAGLVAVRDVDVAQQVAGRMQRRRVGRERVLGVGQRLEHLVVDLDPVGGAARGLGMVGGDDRHRLALVADLGEREHGLVVMLEPVRLAPRHVLVRQHRVHAGDRERGAELDPADARAGVRRAQRRAPQHVLGPHVRRVGELALDLRDAVRAADGDADAVANRRGRGH